MNISYFFFETKSSRSLKSDLLFVKVVRTCLTLHLLLYSYISQLVAFVDDSINANRSLSLLSYLNLVTVK